LASAVLASTIVYLVLW